MMVIFVNGMESMVSKIVVVFYNDSEKVMRKSGKLLSAGSDFLTLETEGHREAIAVKSIIRIIEEARQ
jgi:hypothetical protein